MNIGETESVLAQISQFSLIAVYVPFLSSKCFCLIEFSLFLFSFAGELEKDMFTSLTPLLPSSRATKNSSLISKSYPALYTFRGVLTSSLFKRR